jgi:hypothetical protein
VESPRADTTERPGKDITGLTNHAPIKISETVLELTVFFGLNAVER